MDAPVAWRRDTAGFYWFTVISFALFAGWAVAMWWTDASDTYDHDPGRAAHDTGRVMYSLDQRSTPSYTGGQEGR